jgi:hypothetical protein
MFPASKKEKKVIINCYEYLKKKTFIGNISGRMSFFMCLTIQTNKIKEKHCMNIKAMNIERFPFRFSMAFSLSHKGQKIHFGTMSESSCNNSSHSLRR